MSIIMAINKVLDIKTVQWALLAMVTLLLVAASIQSFRLWVNQKETQYYKAKSGESEAFLQAQNAQVLELKKQGDEAKARVDQKTAEARQIAADYQRKVETLKKQPIREDCCGAIEDAKFIVLGGTP